MLRQSLDEPIRGGARFAYVFGSALLFIFVSQAVTGICLALYYAPSPMTAHASVAYIVKDVTGGAFLRSLHSYGSSAMIVVLLLHFLQTFLYGAYKGKRELLWISGCTLSLLVLGMAFTGYLLSWDQSGYSAASVGTDLVGQVPIIGEKLRLLLRGGAKMGALTLSRFYILHLLIIPGLIFGFIALHIVLFRRAGAAGPTNEDPVSPHLPAETFYPKQVLIDMSFVLVVMGVLGMLAHFVPVTLGPEADPTNTRYLPRPEWYYLPMFQWLKYWEGWRTVIGVVIIPGILIGLVFLLPFMDRGAERRPWRRPIPVGGVFIVLGGLLWLGMTSRLVDSRDPTVAAQLAQQHRVEDVDFHTAFRPYSAPSSPAGVASTPLNTTAAEGKGIFDSHGCSGCHGENGDGAVGPALTHIAGQYPPAQLAALLKAPSPTMKAGGMVALTLSSDEMKGLVSYLFSLDGGSAASSQAPPASVPSSPASGKAESGAVAGPSSAATGTSAVSEAVGNKKPVGVIAGRRIYQTEQCASCHGAGGIGTSKGPPLTTLTKTVTPAALTGVLQHFTAKMQAGGMPPVKATGTDLSALVAYLQSLATPAAAPPAAGAPSPGAASAKLSPAASAGQPNVPGQQTSPAAPTGASKPPQAVSHGPTAPSDSGPSRASANPSDQHGETIFNTEGCGSCHGTGGIGTSKGPALTTLTKTMTFAALTGVLQHPTAKMKAGGMPPVKATGTDLSGLVAYLHSLATPAAAPPAAGAPSPGAASAKLSPAASAGQPNVPGQQISPAAPTGASKPPQAVSHGPTAPSDSGPSRASANPSDQHGETIFNTEGCASCHGTEGIGTSKGPALTTLTKTMTPAALTGVLQHPTAKMQAGGMPPVKATGTDLSALVAYLKSLATPGTAPPAEGTPSPGASSSAASPVASHEVATRPSQPPLSALESKGKLVFEAHRCADCHGTGGVAGTAAAPALAGGNAGGAPAPLTALLQHPNARMQRGGMPPVSLRREDLKALVAYVSHVSASTQHPQ